MKNIPLNTSIKAHLFLGIIIGLWIVVFQILISPFDVADLTFKNKLILIPPYGLLFVLVYILGVVFQNWLYKKTGTWNYLKEALTLCLTYIALLFVCYWYYKSEWINGEYIFIDFTVSIYLPIVIVFTAFIILGRMYLNKRYVKKEKERILLKGKNKEDLLQIDPEDIICISSAQNYVEVHYLQQDQHVKMLLRTPLKTIQPEVPNLIQVHRSHLANPRHFVKWVDSNKAFFHDMEISVSKNYKTNFLNAL